MRDMWWPRGWMDTCISGGRPGVRQDATARAAYREHSTCQPCLCSLHSLTNGFACLHSFSFVQQLH